MAGWLSKVAQDLSLIPLNSRKKRVSDSMLCCAVCTLAMAEGLVLQCVNALAEQAQRSEFHPQSLGIDEKRNQPLDILLIPTCVL